MWADLSRPNTSDLSLKKKKSAFFVFISSILFDVIVSYRKIIPWAYRGVPVDKVCADLSGPNTSDILFLKSKFGILEYLSSLLYNVIVCYRSL